MALSYAEENYLKALIKLSIPADKPVTTNAIAAALNTSAASVTDMLKKLSDKKLITYQRYQGASLTDEGHRLATSLIRKHRLWEVFLVQSLQMPWDEVHDIAEELEHIQSEPLIDKLDAFLGYPKFDPHGDPIPNSQGKYTLRSQLPLTDLQVGQSGMVIGVREDTSSFLKHLTEKGISLGKTATVIAHDNYDHHLQLQIDNRDISLSGQVAQHILVKPL
jgi:DtxR family Mn-dependent transcriptional regulator